MTTACAAPCGAPPSRVPAATRLRSKAMYGAVVVGLIMVLGSFAGISFGASSIATAPSLHVSAAPGTAARAVAPPSTPPSSGTGTFWLNTPLPNVSTNNVNCVGQYEYEWEYPASEQGPCGQVNVTNEPSLNLTTNGYLVTAYTAYTNSTPCEAEYPLLANYTHTQIGITTSSNEGANWSTPLYLGNTNCTTGGSVGVGTGPESALFETDTDNWYVANYASDTVTVISGSSNTVLATINVGTGPIAMADDTYFGYVFVANSGSNNVSVIDVFCPCLVGTLAVGTDPTATMYDYDANCAGVDYVGECYGGVVFVANSGSGNVTALSYNWSQGEFTQSANLTVGGGPSSLAFDQNYPYEEDMVSDATANNVTLIGEYNGTAYQNISVGSGPTALTVLGLTGQVAVANSGSNNVSIISLLTNTVTANIDVGTDPIALAYDPQTQELYVANNGSNDVSVISVASSSVIATIGVGTGPSGILFDANLAEVLVSNYGSANVSAILTTTNTVLRSIPVGTGPAGIWDDGAFEYLVANAGSNNVTLSSDANAQNYVNNWEPSLTSLANGTLVVAWVEFNGTYVPGCEYCEQAEFPEYYEEDSDFGASQLVVSFSYDNGTSWTTPSPIDTSSIYGGGCDYCEQYVDEIQQRPSITALGQTVYLAWTDITEGWDTYEGDQYHSYCNVYGFDCPYGYSNVEFTVSTYGNDNFGPATDLPVLQAPGTNNASLSIAANPAVLVVPNGTVVVAYLSNVSYNGSLGSFSPCYDYSSIYYSDDECGGYQSDLVVAQSSDNGTSWTTGIAAANLSDTLDYQYPDCYECGASQMQQDTIVPGDTNLPAPKVAYDPVSGQVVLAFTADVSYNECLEFYDDCDTYYSNTLDSPQVFTANGNLSTNTWSSRVVSAWSGLSNDGPGGQWGSYFYNPAIVSTSNGTIYLTAQYVNASACTPVPANTWLFYEALNYCGEGLEVFGTSSNGGVNFTSPASVDDTGTWYGEMPPGAQASMVAAGNQVWVAWTQTTCADWLANTTAAEPRCEWGAFAYSFTPAFHLVNGLTANTTVVVSRLFTGAGVAISFAETGLPAGTPWSVDFSGILRSGLAPATLSVSGVPTSSNQSWSSPIISVATGVRYLGTPSLASPGAFTAATTITWTFVLQYTITISTIPAYGVANGGSGGTSTESYLDGYYIESTGLGGCNEGYYFNAGGSDDNCYYWEYTSINYNITPDPGTNWVDAGTTVPLQVTQLNASQFWEYFACLGCEWQYVNLSFEAWTGTGVGSYNGTSNSTSVTVNSPINETASFGINAYCYWTDSPGFISDCAPSGLTYVFNEVGLPKGTPWGVSVWGPNANQTTPYPAFTTNSTLPVTDPSLTGLAYFQAYTVPSTTPGEVWVPHADPESPILGPLQSGSTLTYTLTPVGSSAFASSVSEVGLPNGTAWGFSVDGTGTGVSGAAVDNVTLPGGSHQLSAGPVYLDNGTGYVATSIDILPFVMNESWTNESGSAATYTFNGSAQVIVQYTPIYELTTTASAGGTVTNAGTMWLTGTQKVALIATPNPGYSFVGWTGTGVGSTTTTSLTPPTEINVTATAGPVSELAVFAPNPLPLYVVTVTATGLLTGGSYAVTFDGTTYTGTGSFALPSYLGGNYTISVPVAYDNSSSQTRFAPVSFTASGFGTGPAGTYDLDANGASIAIDFATQYSLTVGSAGPAGSGSTTPASGVYWETTTNTTALQATVNPGYIFVGWVGTGPGGVNSTASTLPVTLSSPAGETAMFAPYVAPPPATYNLTVTETGLPAGTSWSFSDGVTGVSSTSSTITFAGLNGSYTVTAPPVRIGAGEQYTSSVTSVAEAVTANTPLSVLFSGEYQLTVSSGMGGSATPGTEWVPMGQSVALTATPNAGYTFVGWVGTGTGNYTGSTASTSVTVSSVITETAQFEVTPTTKVVQQTSSTGVPSYLPWVALVALLAIGLIAGYAISRRGSSGGGGTPPPPPAAAPADAAGAPPGAFGGAPAPDPSAEYDESK